MPFVGSTSALSDQGLHCLLTESVPVVYVGKQRTLRSECTDADAYLDLQYSHLTKEPFSHILQQLFL